MKQYWILALLIAPSAYADGPHVDTVVYDKEIGTYFGAGQIRHPDLAEVNHGQLTIDQEQNVIRARFTKPRPCPPNAVCATNQVLVATVEVPLAEGQPRELECGVKSYTGQVDRRPVDGALQRITILDNSGLSCLSMAPVPPTEIIYETDSPRSGSFRSTFYGQALN